MNEEEKFFKYLKNLSEKKAQAKDALILSAIVGARIVSIEVEPIKNRKHMKMVTITHDGQPNVVIDKNNGCTTAVQTNPIKLRVKP